MQNVPAVVVPLDPLANYIYIQHETSHLPATKAYLCLDSSLTQYYFPNHRSMILILKCSFLWKKYLCLAIFHRWGSTNSRLEPLWGDSFLLTLNSQKFMVLIFYKLWRTKIRNTEIWSKEKTIGPYAAKMLFLQVDEGFWLPVLR